MFGPESTGKTTLAKQLADHFKTVWAPEFARDYLQQKWDDTKQTCEPEDLLPIAIGQTQLENKALLLANNFHIYTAISWREFVSFLDKLRTFPEYINMKIYVSNLFSDKYILPLYWLCQKHQQKWQVVD